MLLKENRGQKGETEYERCGKRTEMKDKRLQQKEGQEREKKQDVYL